RSGNAAPRLECGIERIRLVCCQRANRCKDDRLRAVFVEVGATAGKAERLFVDCCRAAAAGEESRRHIDCKDAREKRDQPRRTAGSHCQYPAKTLAQRNGESEPSRLKIVRDPGHRRVESSCPGTTGTDRSERFDRFMREAKQTTRLRILHLLRHLFL